MSGILFVLIPLLYAWAARSMCGSAPAYCLAVIALLACSGCERKPDSPSKVLPSTQEEPASPEPLSEAGHDRMLGLLEQIAARAARDHPTLGDRDARTLREQLAKVPPAAAQAAPQMTTLRLHWLLGTSELRLGNLETGLEHYLKVRDWLNQLRKNDPVPPQLDIELAYKLGIAYMRRGETNNCCLRNSPDSCLLPIKGTGIHTQKEDSRQAITYFAKVLQKAPPNSPMYLKARWLLNIMYMTVDGYPDEVPQEYLIRPSVFESEEPFPRFVNVAHKLGVDTFDLLGGAIIDDFTGDGYLDIVVSTYDLSEQMHFFRNNQDGTFTDRTREANLVGLVGGFNLVQADYDNDGDLDILMLRGAWTGIGGKIPNSLLRNDGHARFTDVTFAAGLGEVHYPTQTAAWADYDNDGDLDLYIGNETQDGVVHAPCQLFRNDGDGTFTDVAKEAGVLNAGFTKGVAWGDYDDDGLPDIYVSNLGAANRLFRNNGDGTFTDVAQQVGATGPRSSFPVWFWDFDNDGILDLYVSNYGGDLATVAASRLGLPVEHEMPHLYRGNGHGGFEEVAEAQNLTHLTLPMGVNWGDLDNDGYPDFYLGTGYPDYEALMPNVMYRNRGGTGFSDVTTAGGFGNLQKGHGAVFADLDNDGDQDIFEQMGGFFRGDKYFNALFENPGFGNHWIAVELVGVRSNRSAIGARIQVTVTENSQERSIYKHVNSGGSFGSNPLRQTIGVGKSTRIKTLRVYWPTTGQTQTFHDLAVDQFVRITEGTDEYTRVKLKKLKLGSSPGNR